MSIISFSQFPAFTVMHSPNVSALGSPSSCSGGLRINLQFFPHDGSHVRGLESDDVPGRIALTIPSLRRILLGNHPRNESIRCSAAPDVREDNTSFTLRTKAQLAIGLLYRDQALLLSLARSLDPGTVAGGQLPSPHSWTNCLSPPLTNNNHPWCS